MRKLTTLMLVVGLITFAMLGITDIKNSKQTIQLQEIELKDTSAELQQLNDRYDNLLKENEIDEQKLEELQEQKKDLEEQLQAKLEKQEAERIALQKASEQLKLNSSGRMQHPLEIGLLNAMRGLHKSA